MENVAFVLWLVLAPLAESASLWLRTKRGSPAVRQPLVFVIWCVIYVTVATMLYRP